MNHVSLFSGIGGFDLAAEWAGFTTVLFVEQDEYCQKVLRKHWPNVPIIGDIRDVNEKTVADSVGVLQQSGRAQQGERQLAEEDARGIGGAGRELPAIDLLTGGFPCQPFSVAGQRGGDTDDRFLWPEMLRVIALLKPRWVLAENVAGIINMALDDVLSDLEGEGYETGTVVLPACAVNAPHRRDRVWIVAHDTKQRCTAWRPERTGFCGESAPTDGCEDASNKAMDDTEGGRRRLCQSVNERQVAGDVNAPSDAGEVVPDTDEQGLQGPQREHGLRESSSEVAAGRRSERDGRNQRATQSRVGRTSDGLPPRMDGGWDDGWEGETPRVSEVRKPDRVNRLRCLGNAIVPQVAFQILKSVVEIES